jgi:DNA-binding transcriptional LysR family regulator
MKGHPNIDIDLEERPSYDIVQAIKVGQADIGIVADSVDLTGLQAYPFRRDRLVVVAAGDHPLLDANRNTKGRAIDFEHTLAFDFVGMAGDSALQQYLIGQAAHLGKRMTYRIRLRSFDAICRMVESRIGIGIVPESAAIRCQRSMAIRRIRLANPWAVRQLTICARNFDELPQYAKHLVDAIKA